MKKSKKLVSLFLAMVFTLSLMVIPALASDGTDVEPQAVVTHCFRCDGSVISCQKVVGESAQVLVSCPNYSSPHYHTGKKDYFSVVCANCGHYEELIRLYDFESNCPYK